MEPEKQNENTEAPVTEGAPQEESQPQFTPTPEETMVPPTPEPEKKGSLGPIVGIIIIVILIVLAGFYFWGSSLQNSLDAQPTENVEDTTTDGGDTTVIPTEVGAPLSESDAVSDLEGELLDTDLNNLDAELDAIEAELSN